jgi:hypothetical protein
MVFWLEVVLSVTTAGLGLVTAVWPAWIENVFGVDPDHGSGALEWVVVGCCLCLTVAFSLAARSTIRGAGVVGAADSP